MYLGPARLWTDTISWGATDMWFTYMKTADPINTTTANPSASIRLGDVPGAARTLLAALSRPRRWRNGQTIVHQGDCPGSVFTVRSGRVRIRVIGQDGNERVLGWLRIGYVGALASVLANEPYPCDFVAEGSCDLDHVDGDRLTEALASDPQACLALARVMAERLVHVTAKYSERSSAPLANRVEATIARMVAANKRSDEREPEVLRISQADFARSVGGSRYRVSVVLRNMRDQGRVALLRRAIVHLA